MVNLDEHLRKLLYQLERSPNEDTGIVAAGIIDGEKAVYEIAQRSENGQIIHAERSAFRSFTTDYGSPSNNAWVVTTLSPCVYPDGLRYGCSCTDLLRGKDDSFSKVPRFHTGFVDPLQVNKSTYEDLGLTVSVTENSTLRECCENLYEYFTKVNKKKIDIQDLVSKALNPL